MNQFALNLTYKTRYVCLFICLSVCCRTAGPIKTKLGIGIHVELLTQGVF